MEEAGKYINLVSDQIPFSMVNRKTDETTIPWCMKHNKSVLAYSPMERGLLTGKITPGYKFAEGDHRANNSFLRRTVSGKRMLSWISFVHWHRRKTLLYPSWY